MTFHEYLSKAVQNDAQRAGERDRLIWTVGDPPTSAVRTDVAARQPRIRRE